MTKEQYLQVLRKNLKHMSDDDKEDIINEYTTHFYSGLTDGKSEQQICKELGDPKQLAKEHNAFNTLDQANTQHSFNNIMSAIFTTMGLSLLNFVVILVPFILLLCVMAFLVTFTIAGLLGPVMLIVKGIIDGFNSILLFDGFMAGLMFGCGLMLLVITSIFFKYTYSIVVKYLKWNIKLVKRSVH
ncbi:DUF1700 domain-containing protein [Staphylococcus simiae]|uniref:HAAS signaling domain-containing protein n=1 Tax=Staphylococcus simiae TaxID=308354 RepID=UPI001A95DDD2|nr:DUF1700 domain-containing protein [Staphylococcus simiae]MBO1198655.1 DUF1700 domain-containing protein [Staphylococcus simiae]MBO1200860.1 DUF1700 domain-containing protein [Staphylococcus simiae]MBO1203068.1 DUF1700 domain-containing protein [Staphylococcus simiae]MBO1211281.1 DUF1700 domain-containing protein [Staphylococcus simiae]MBO1229196.1 DUF1700 domain-containing protein [Staphylococcus simiae]